MPKRLAEIEAERAAELAEAEQWAVQHGGGNTPGRRLENGETASPQQLGHHGDSGKASRSGTRYDDLPRQHRDTLSYSAFENAGSYEDWLIDSGQGYNPLVSKSMPGIGMAEQRDLLKHTRVHHCLSYLTDERVALLFRRHVERMTLDAIATEEGVSRQAIIKRLRVAERHLKEAIREHWNDEETWEL